MPLRRALSLRENLPVRCRPVGAWVSLRVRARLQQDTQACQARRFTAGQENDHCWALFHALTVQSKATTSHA